MTHEPLHCRMGGPFGPRAMQRARHIRRYGSTSRTPRRLGWGPYHTAGKIWCMHEMTEKWIPGWKRNGPVIPNTAPCRSPWGITTGKTFLFIMRLRMLLPYATSISVHPLREQARTDLISGQERFARSHAMATQWPT